MKLCTTTFATLALAMAGPAIAANDGPIPAAQLRQDLVVIGSVLRDQHPDIRHSALPAVLEPRMREIDRELDHPMSRDEAWRLFSTLNPLLADAHLVIGYPSWRGDLKRHVEAGGRLFPFEVATGPAGDVQIVGALGGAPSPLAGARVERINGLAAGAVVRPLLDRMAGETARLRANLLSSRFAYMYWRMFGARADFDLVVRQDGRRRNVHVPGVAALPLLLVDEGDFDREFSLALMPCHAAVLRLNSFAWEDKPQFLAFTRNAFSRIRDAGVRTLVIDIRTNEGGNDDMWRDGVMPYIATARYQWASSYKKRVMTPDPAKGEKVGDIVSGKLETWIEPDPSNPLHFDGKTYVLVGPRTYSSSILFTNVMRDFGFATIAGAGGLVRADQSGGTRVTTLPNSGLTIVWPRFILKRPSGQTAPVLLQPDIRLADGPLHSDDAIARLTRCPAETVS